MEASLLAFALIAKKKNHLAILDLGIWETVKFGINHGAKTVGNFCSKFITKNGIYIMPTFKVGIFLSALI